MRVVMFLVGFVLLFAASAVAQGPAGVGSTSGPRYDPLYEHMDQPWQIAVGYQYNRDNLLGAPFNTYGANFSVARYFRRWIGVEAQAGGGFYGNTGQTTTPPRLSAKSLFVGVGPRLSYPNRSRYEPWVHVLVGWEHYRFSQTAGLLGSNSGLAVPLGGGLDVYLSRHVAIRGEADALESRLFSVNQRSFQAIGGLVYNF